MAYGRTIMSTVSKDVLYLDASKAESITENIQKSLTKIATQFENCAKAIDKAGKSSGDIKTQFAKLSKSCKNQASYAKNKCKTLQSKFQADTQEYTVQLLTNRLTELEAKVKAFEEQVNKQPDTPSK